MSGRGGGAGRAFYGWWIVGAGCSVEALIGALMFHSYGAYVVVLREEFGWSKTMLSAAFAMARAESGIFGPVQGWLTDRFGPQILIRVGMTIFGVGFMLLSQIGSRGHARPRALADRGRTWLGAPRRVRGDG